MVFQHSFWKDKKILFLDSYKSDYLQDIVYQGLVQILGKSRVIEYPFNRNYHFPLRRYPLNLAYHPSIRPLEWSVPYILSNFSAIVLGAAKPDVFESYLKLLPKIPPNVPVLFIDGGDFSAIGGDLERLKHWELYTSAIQQRPFDLILKREYLLTEHHGNEIQPMPFAAHVPQQGFRRQAAFKYDVSFWAVESHPVRTEALRLIENHFDCKANGTVRNQIFSKYKRKGIKYLEALAECKIVLNFRGAGWDTLRYWEVPALGKALMISQKPQILIPDNFEDKKEVVFVKDDLSDLLELCEYYLSHGLEREEIVKNAQIKTLTHHLPIHRAQTVLTYMQALIEK